MNDVNDIEQFITSNILTVFNKQAPIVTKKVTRPKAPWKNTEINEKIKLKNKLRKKYWKTRDSRDWKNYKGIRNELNILIWRRKKEFLTDTVAANNKDMKNMWKCLKKCDIVSDKKGGNIPQDLDLEAMNKFFAEMGGGCEANSLTIIHYNESKKRV